MKNKSVKTNWNWRRIAIVLGILLLITTFLLCHKTIQAESSPVVTPCSVSVFIDTPSEEVTTRDFRVASYQSVMVKQGDSLWKLAKSYLEESLQHVHSQTGDEILPPNSREIKNYIREIKELNHMKDNSIQKGKYILLPIYEI